VIDAGLGIEGAGFESFDQEAGLVLACSALKRTYREILVGQKSGVQIVFLQGSEALLQARLSLREHAFMPEALLQSQLATLEAPKDALTIDIADPAEALVAQICTALLT
jgi:gluconokinase